MESEIKLIQAGLTLFRIFGENVGGGKVTQKMTQIGIMTTDLCSELVGEVMKFSSG